REVGAMLGLARRSVDDRLAAARTKLRAELSGSPGLVLIAALEPGWTAPHVDPSPALRARLEALALSVGGATVAGGTAAWASGAGLVALAAMATLWDRSGFFVERSRDDAQVAQTNQATFEGRGEALAPVSVGNGRVDADRAIAISKDVDPSPAFVIEIVDEAGGRVDGATLVLAASGSWAGRRRPTGPSSGPWALGVRMAATSNPIELPPAPPELDGVLVHASAFKPGFGSAAPAYLVPSGDAPRAVRLVLTTPQDLALEVLENGTEDAVPGALVVAVSELQRAGVEPKGASTPVDRRFVTRTDALGRCRLVGLGGDRPMLEVHADGYRAQQVVGRERASHARVFLVPDAFSASVTALVLGPNGAPVAGLDLHCASMSMSQSTVERTDGAGVARFEGLSAGHRIVRIDEEQAAERGRELGWPAQGSVLERRVDLRSGESEEILLGFVPGDAAWHIELVDADGRPVVGRSVTLRKDSLRQGRTDETGHVAFDGLEPGAYYFASSERWQPGAHRLRAGETLRSRFVIGDRTLRGTVRFEDGRPVAGANLAFGDLYTESARTDEGGAFEVPGAPPGDYYVHVDVFGFPDVTTRVTVEPGLDPAPLDLVVPRGGTLRVRVPGSAERGLRIAAIDPSGRSSWLKADPTATEQFESPPLAPGAYTLVVCEGRTEVYETTVPVNVRAGETAETTVLLPH
ncbi:MAG: carboxypeptidase-like regulatory domain-containing protein, partial [Planctomycetota bacterium]